MLILNLNTFVYYMNIRFTTYTYITSKDLFTYSNNIVRTL